MVCNKRNQLVPAYSNKNKTPVIYSLQRLAQKRVQSFHALPISNFREMDTSFPFLDEKVATFESSVAETHFDDFFFTKNVLAESEDLTASLFNASGTLFVTSGTTVSNQIALVAFDCAGKNMLIDKNCHQSIHFTSQLLNAKVDYIDLDIIIDKEMVSAWSTRALLNKILEKQATGEFFDVIVLTAQSYDGLVYDIPAVIELLLKNGVKTRKFLIDEAWGCFNYFLPKLKKIAALNIDKIAKVYPDLQMICTQSAHKSLICLRQGSYVHYKGDQNLKKQLELAKFKVHTTSPNYSILASLDFAQYHIREYGQKLAVKNTTLIQYFLMAIRHDERFKLFRIKERAIPIEHHHIQFDPTKVLLDVSLIGDAEEVKNRLFEQNIYVKRILGNYLLFNFHIGINQSIVQYLLDCLYDISKQCTENKKVSSNFVVAYPPGTPLLVPGDNITSEIAKKINQLIKKGILIIAT